MRLDVHDDIDGDPDDDTVVVRLSGDLDVVTAADLWPHLSGLITAGHVRIAIDCSGLTFLDSSGIAVLVRGLRMVTPLGGSLRLRAVGHRVLEVLTITSLTEAFLDEAELRQAQLRRATSER
jgi:anti-sigma B factor antagonist